MKNRLKRVVVNRHVIRQNRNHGTDYPPLSVQEGGTTSYAHEVAINGPSVVVYRPDRPLSCGASVWIETRSPVLRVTRSSAAAENEEVG